MNPRTAVLLLLLSSTTPAFAETPAQRDMRLARQLEAERLKQEKQAQRYAPPAAPADAAPERPTPRLARPEVFRASVPPASGAKKKEPRKGSGNRSG